jgi:hypothetical protein
MTGMPRPWPRPPASRRSARAHPRLVEPPTPQPHIRPAPAPGTGTDQRRAPADLTAPAALPAKRADAGALAAAFGVDFLSWDEGDPQRRGRALAPYAVPPVLEEQLAGTGWPGRGRQRGEFALPGAVIALSEEEDRLLVHVRVRVTPFRRLPRAPACVRHSMDVLPYPAAAPAPTDPGWVGLDSYWYELLVPVREVAEQWRVDIATVIAVPPLPRNGVVPP